VSPTPHPLSPRSLTSGRVYSFEVGVTIAAPKKFLPDCANLHMRQIAPVYPTPDYNYVCFGVSTLTNVYNCTRLFYEDSGLLNVGPIGIFKSGLHFFLRVVIRLLRGEGFVIFDFRIYSQPDRYYRNEFCFLLCIVPGLRSF
jgi:hypothetical protein